jgi:hypothetical protein
MGAAGARRGARYGARCDPPPGAPRFPTLGRVLPGPASPRPSAVRGVSACCASGQQGLPQAGVQGGRLDTDAVRIAELRDPLGHAADRQGAVLGVPGSGTERRHNQRGPGLGVEPSPGHPPGGVPQGPTAEDRRQRRRPPGPGSNLVRRRVASSERRHPRHRRQPRQPDRQQPRPDLHGLRGHRSRQAAGTRRRSSSRTAPPTSSAATPTRRRARSSTRPSTCSRLRAAPWARAG